MFAAWLIAKIKKVLEWADVGVDIPSWILQILTWCDYAFDAVGNFVGQFFGIFGFVFNVCKHSAIFLNRLIVWYHDKYSPKSIVVNEVRNPNLPLSAMKLPRENALQKINEQSTREQPPILVNTGIKEYDAYDKARQHLETLRKVKSWAENFDFLGDFSLNALVVCAFFGAVVPVAAVVALTAIAGIFGVFKIVTVITEFMLERKMNKALEVLLKQPGSSQSSTELQQKPTNTVQLQQSLGVDKNTSHQKQQEGHPVLRRTNVTACSSSFYQPEPGKNTGKTRRPKPNSQLPIPKEINQNPS
jgi:hypothetical protein